jgi:hypothetical protein
MVNSGLKIYLTDFLNRTFRGENAQKSRFLRRGEKKSGALYHAGINHGAGLRNDAGGATAHSEQQRIESGRLAIDARGQKPTPSARHIYCAAFLRLFKGSTSNDAQFVRISH